MRAPAGDLPLAMASKVVGLMRLVDGGTVLESVIRRQEAAEAAFVRAAYSALDKFPPHPAAPALAAYRRYLAGRSTDVISFRGLSWLGWLLELHAPDWAGRELDLGRRLLAPNHFWAVLFELEASYELRRHGHATRWRGDFEAGTADLLVDDALDVECVHPDESAGMPVPYHLAAHLAGQVLRVLDRAGRDAAVLLAADSLVPADAPTIEQRLRRAIRRGERGTSTWAYRVSRSRSMSSPRSPGRAPRRTSARWCAATRTYR